MSAEATPAVQRAYKAMRPDFRKDLDPGILGGLLTASTGLAAALDLEEIARELFVADSWQDPAFMRRLWDTAPEDQVVKKHWRRIATALRAALLGGAS